jgi:hypothetical protein
MKRRWPTLLIALIVVAATCALVYWFFFKPTPIKRIIDNPRAFDGRMVLIAGTTRRAVGLLGYGGYEVDDGTGRIIVVTDAGLPPVGATVRVRGLAKQAYTLGTRSLTVVVEKKRRWRLRHPRTT